MKLKDAEKMARELMDKHGLTKEFNSFKFDNAVKRFGRWRGGILKTEISLSRKLVKLNDEDIVRGVILHEIAHALTPFCGHNGVWKKKLLEIGGDGERCYSDAIVKTPVLKYVGECPNGHKTYFSRKPKSSYSCGTCCKTYNPNFALTIRESDKK